MQLVQGRFVFSATDLNNDLECGHLTALQRQVALGTLVRPDPDDVTRLIAEKGEAHERRYLETLQGYHGDKLVVFPSRTENTREAMLAAEAETLAAMERGAAIIYQAAFFDGTFLGRADFLRRIERPCEKWDWSYEVIDTKLALNPKPYFLIQLCNYSEHVARLQGAPPEYGSILLGSGIERRFRINDYAAYYRHQKAAFLERAAAHADSYPVECSHCAICNWYDVCERKREADGYLGLVAWMRNDQITKLATQGITTLPQLAAAARAQRPRGMRTETFAKLQAQAALQERQRNAFANRTSPRHFWGFLDDEQCTGFALLPEPDEGDVFFDMEGDPLYAPARGLEYLFGLYLPAEDTYVAHWARSADQERAAFEAVIDFLVERRARYPKMHVYHYAPYETSALRRLMGRYGTRERELDALLRGQVFIDLYAVVRRTVQISQPSYSIKKLEPFYDFYRKTDVRRGDDSIVLFESWLISQDGAILEDIERYNEDDCRSTALLHRWLLARRADFAAKSGRELPWRPPPEPPKEEEDDGRDALARALLAGLPDFKTADELRQSAEDVRARWILGHALEYHRREEKPTWWRIFDRCENVDQLEEFDHEAIGGVRLRDDIACPPLVGRERLKTYTYEFPEQQYYIDVDAAPYAAPQAKSAGTLVGIDADHNLLQLKVAAAITPADIRALIPGAPVNSDPMKNAVRRVAQAYIDGALEQHYPAVADILLARTPRLGDRQRGMPVQPETVTAAAVSTVARALDGSYLFIQGPPGSGKSTKGASVIVDLIESGKRVAILSRSHKAIHHLIHKVEEEAQERGKRFAGLYKQGADSDSIYRSEIADPMVESTSSNALFETRSHDLAGGTAWLFSREQLEGRYDYLFIDEAGQVALADALACAPCARNVVLLGDPLQLAQVSQNSHPVGAGVSILEHLLGDHATVPEDRGIFLDVSYRMHPRICRFVSDAVYAGRLDPDTTTVNNHIDAPTYGGAGLRYMPVEHSANMRESPEEADAIAQAVAPLMTGTVTVCDKPPRPMTQADILVVTPYNAQRKLITARLAADGFPDIRVGTVDKFQGQEAPVVFYSMATSSGADVPRDMAFLFEKNRLNVAISRAQCLTFIVCSPRLLEISCNTPEQMALANLLCAFAETATLA